MGTSSDRWIPLSVAIAVALTGGLARAYAAEDDGARKGWRFYKEPAEENDREEVRDKALPPPPSPSATSPKPPELIEVEALQKQVEALRRVAAPNTSEHNGIPAGV